MYGPARAERFQRLLDSVTEMAPVRVTTMGAYASEWEQTRCPWHADGVGEVNRLVRQVREASK